MTNRFAHEIYFDVVLKLSERCDLACPYCYYYFAKYDPHARPALMTEDVAERLPGFLLAAAHELALTHINVVFHGGEPLLYGKNRFRKLCERLSAVLSDAPVKVRYGIQTNGLKLDDEWISIFHHYGVRLGISIDGLKDFHDASRPDHNGRGSFERVKRSLRSAQHSCETRGHAAPGAIAVIHPDMTAERILPSLIDELGIVSPNLNFPRGGHDDPTSKQFEADTGFSSRLMRTYLEGYTSPKFHYVRGLSEFVVAMFSEKGAAVNDKRSSTQHFIVTIASDGGIHPDDNLISASPDLTHSGMNVLDTSLRDFVESDFFWKLTYARDFVPAKCSDCQWYRVCRSGQMFNRAGSEGFRHESSVCESLKVLYLESARFLVESGVISTRRLGAILSSEPTMLAETAHRRVLEK
ncbi:MAG: radical SAM protein [Pseudomonadota bacterium]